MKQSFGELIGNIIPLGILVYFGLVMKGIIKPKKDIPKLTNPTTLIKILIYGGILIFVVIVIISLIG